MRHRSCLRCRFGLAGTRNVGGLAIPLLGTMGRYFEVSMPLLVAQGTPDELMPGICAVVGFVVIPGTLIVWATIIRRHRRSIPERNVGLWIAGLAAALVCLLWAAAAIDVPFELRRVLTGRAKECVQYEPAVARFIQGGSRRGLEVLDRSHPPDLYVIAVGDCDAKGHVTRIWNTFAVDAKDDSVGTSYHVSVLVDPKSAKWVPLEQWQELEGAQTQPTTQP